MVSVPLFKEQLEAIRRDMRTWPAWRMMAIQAEVLKTPLRRKQEMDNTVNPIIGIPLNEILLAMELIDDYYQLDTDTHGWSKDLATMRGTWLSNRDRAAALVP